MIDYLEKAGLQEALEAVGITLKEKFDVSGVGTWIVSPAARAAEAQIFIDAYDELPSLKSLKIQEVKQEGLNRINQIFPAISSFDELQLVREQYLSINAAARSPTADFQSAIDVYTAGRDAISVINNLLTSGDVTSYDVTVDPGWP